MILKCEACGTRYLVKNQDIGEEGRHVRCARCHHTWYQTPVDESEAAEAEDPIDIQPPPQEAKPIPPYSNVPAFIRAPNPKVLHYMAGILSLLFISLLSAVFVYKDSIVTAWEPAARLYDQLGIPVPPTGQGLAFSGVNVHTYTVNGQIALLVSGKIFNTTAQVKRVPPITLIPRDAARNPLLQWAHYEPAVLSPGESLEFRTQKLTDNMLVNTILIQFDNSVDRDSLQEG